MSSTTETLKTTADELEFTAFYVDDLLLGIDIRQVQEINRHLDTTEIPHAPDCVRGIINLRGEVVTVLDLRVIMGMDQRQIDEKSRNIIVRADGENIGLLVDLIADVVVAPAREIESSPANVSGVDSRFFEGIYKLKSGLMAILDVNEVVSAESGENR